MADVTLDPALRAEMELLLAERERRASEYWRSLFATPEVRAQYAKHMEHFAAGKVHREILCLGANRVGKSLAGAYQVTLHLTGEYPEWWPGRRFPKPTRCWAAGDTSKTVRDIIQPIFLGSPDDPERRMLAERVVIRKTSKAGIPDAIDTIHVRHVTGGTSVLTLKSYDQGRESFQGTKMDVIWLDEEPPSDINAECLLRTMATDAEGQTDGMLILTLTPLMGMTPLIMSYLQPEVELVGAIAGQRRGD